MAERKNKRITQKVSNRKSPGRKFGAFLFVAGKRLLYNVSMLNQLSKYHQVIWGFLAGFLIMLLGFFFYGFSQISLNESIGALGNVLGGAIGALGSAAAVYWTLTYQKKDEENKIFTSLIHEVMQVLNDMSTCIGGCETLLTLPVEIRTVKPFSFYKPIVFPAIADKLGMLPAPRSVISFYTSHDRLMRATEALGSDSIIVNDKIVAIMVDDEIVMTLLGRSIDVCMRGLKVLRKWDKSNSLDSKNIEAMIPIVENIINAQRKKRPGLFIFKSEGAL